MKQLKDKLAILFDSLTEKRRFLSMPLHRNDRVGMLYRCWGYVFTNLLKGAYYEFGVYKGDTCIESWKAYSGLKKWVESQLSSPEAWRREALKEYAHYPHHFYGFDTFEGMPENDEKNSTFSKDSFFASLNEVERKCLEKKMEIRFFKGLFSDIPEETMNDLQPAVIVNIDSDLYFSARDALEKVKDKLQQGTVLLMDDYNCFSADNSQGERRALKEFCLKYPRIQFEPWFIYATVGQAFICHLA
ncbi:MAG: TylF/MycF/NovP-related O-methyltransferase [bacterium]|nr:TylF/MycF/NovP-related O-methyltransferase [bacterium]